MNLFQFDRGRRRVLAGAASVVAAGCQTVQPDRQLVTVNLAEIAPAPPAPPAGEVTRLETAFDQASRMSVPVFVNGAGPHQFVVDTGANRSVIAQELAGSLNLESLGPAAVHGIAGVEPAPLYRVRMLRVGGVFSTNLQLPGAPVARLGADGLVGVDVLRNRRVTLGFARNEFFISPSVLRGSMGRGGGTRLPPVGDRSVTVVARYRFGQLIIVDAEVAGIPVTAFLDSGSQVTVGNEALRRAILRAQPGLVDRFVDAPLVSATGQVAHGQYTALPPLRLGGLIVQQLSAVFADLHIFDLWGLLQQPAILIGVDVLRRFETVVLDFGRREVSFTPPRPQRNRPPTAGSPAPGP